MLSLKRKHVKPKVAPKSAPSQAKPYTGPIDLTAAHLIRGIGAKPAAADLWVNALRETMHMYGIDKNPVRAAMFIAQVGHESGRLEHANEIWGPTEAQRRYEGRRDLGNVRPGDGSRYRGHGLIQTTGRANHLEATLELRKQWPDCPDFEADPDKLGHVPWGAYSAGAFWNKINLNVLADTGNVTKVTRVINGGYNGLSDRQNLYKAMLRVLT